MSYQNARVFICLLLVFGMAGLKAQEAIPATGGEATGAGGTASYTVGQLFYVTMKGTDGTITQGVQQPYEIMDMPGVSTPRGISLQCILFPNPVSEYVKLRVDNYPLSGLSYQLYNLQGELLDSRDISGNETHIRMAHLGASTYVIRILQNNQELKAFKIIKK